MTRTSHIRTPRTSRISRSRLTAVGAVGVLALGIGACGSSSKSTSTPTTVAPAATSPSATSPSATTPSAAATSASVKIVNFSFSPPTVTVKVGGTVTWTQVDQTGHSVQSTSTPPAWKTSAVLKPGQTFSHTFTKAGTYPYICGVHNYMMGTVKVVG